MELFPLTSIGSIVGTEAATSGRRCGECTACCDGGLKINVYGGEVYPGHPCPHSSGHHCLIYERRPLDPCQRFFCGWLMPASPLPDWLRPDKAKVIFLPAQFKWNGQDVDVAVPVGDGPDDKTIEWFKNFASEHKRLLLYRMDQRSEEHTSELQSLAYLVCRLLLEKKKQTINTKAI